MLNVNGAKRSLLATRNPIIADMCNLYSITKGQAAIREFTRAMRDTGNLLGAWYFHA